MFVYLLVRFLSYVASPIFNRNNYYRIVLTDQNSKVAPEIRKSDENLGMSSFLLFPQSPHSSSKVDFLPSLNFLFPFPAIDLINNLLQVKQRCRYTCDKSLIHPWLQVSLPNVMQYSVNTDNIRTSFVDISLFSVFHLIYIAYFNASLKICLFAQKHTLGNSSIQLSDLICFLHFYTCYWRSVSSTWLKCSVVGLSAM